MSHSSSTLLGSKLMVDFSVSGIMVHFALFFRGRIVSHVTKHLTSLWSGALLYAKLSLSWELVPAPTVSHVWVNPPSQD